MSTPWYESRLFIWTLAIIIASSIQYYRTKDSVETTTPVVQESTQQNEKASFSIIKVGKAIKKPVKYINPETTHNAWFIEPHEIKYTKNFTNDERLTTIEIANKVIEIENYNFWCIERNNKSSHEICANDAPITVDANDYDPSFIKKLSAYTVYHPDNGNPVDDNRPITDITDKFTEIKSNMHHDLQQYKGWLVGLCSSIIPMIFMFMIKLVFFSDETDDEALRIGKALIIAIFITLILAMWYADPNPELINNIFASTICFFIVCSIVTFIIAYPAAALTGLGIIMTVGAVVNMVKDD